MIVVRVELHSAVTGRVTELARMAIANDGETTAADRRRGSYVGRVFNGRSTAALNEGVVQRTGSVANYPRESLHVWNLVARMLAGMGYR